MAKFIDADRLLQRLTTINSTVEQGIKYYNSVYNFVNEQPAADVVEVKRGEWKLKGQDIYCSVCGNESAYNPFGASKFSDYCPNCGANMRGEEK